MSDFSFAFTDEGTQREKKIAIMTVTGMRSEMVSKSAKPSRARIMWGNVQNLLIGCNGKPNVR